MSMKRAAILTLMSWFGVIGCNSGDDGPPGGTSLEGPYPCDSTECGSGELCVTFYAGLDAGPGGGTDRYCQAAPDGCVITDCYGTDCAQCIRDICYAASGFSVQVQGRNLTCPGV